MPKLANKHNRLRKRDISRNIEWFSREYSYDWLGVSPEVMTDWLYEARRNYGYARMLYLRIEQYHGNVYTYYWLAGRLGWPLEADNDKPKS